MPLPGVRGKKERACRRKARSIAGQRAGETLLGRREEMKGNCALLGFPIDRDVSCRSSGNHPLCRKCLAGDKKESDSLDRNRKPRKRCECGRFFFMNSNRQIYCPKCQKRGYRKKAREWDGETRGNKSQIRELGGIR